MRQKIYLLLFPLVFIPGFASSSLAMDVRPPATAGLMQFVADEKALEGAKAFINNVSQKGINFLADPNLSHDQRRNEFRQLLQSSFDTAIIGKFALGRYWKSATPQQQKEYLKLFNQMIVDIYSNRFNEYQGQDLQVISARKDGEKDILVSSVIISAKDKSKITVDWRVRPQGGGYRIIDVIVEGVSMALTQRSDFASVIQRGGGNLNVLLEHMRGQG